MATQDPAVKQRVQADIKSYAKLLRQFDLTELEVESEGTKIRLSRMNGGVPVGAYAMAPAMGGMALEGNQTAPGGATAKDDGSIKILSPFVGTFYRASSPETPPFAEVGQTVSKGTTLCIIEAMKLMNEIEAEMDCKIVEVLVKNADPVEYGQPLFKVVPA